MPTRGRESTEILSQSQRTGEVKKIQITEEDLSLGESKVQCNRFRTVGFSVVVGFEIFFPRAGIVVLLKGWFKKLSRRWSIWRSVRRLRQIVQKCHFFLIFGAILTYLNALRSLIVRSVLIFISILIGLGSGTNCKNKIRHVRVEQQQAKTNLRLWFDSEVFESHQSFGIRRHGEDIVVVKIDAQWWRVYHSLVRSARNDNLFVRLFRDFDAVRFWCSFQRIRHPVSLMQRLLLIHQHMECVVLQRLQFEHEQMAVLFVNHIGGDGVWVWV